MNKNFRLLEVIGLIACLGLTGTALARPNYVCILEGQQQVPAVSSPGIGSGIFNLDTANHTLTFHISYSGLTSPETGAHIHLPGAPGVNAGIAFPLPTGSVKTGVWTGLTLSDESAIRAGAAYVNVHTVANSGGEIRGQICNLAATLNGAQETPANGSQAQGFGVFMIDTVAKKLDYYLAYSGFTSPVNAAHIHGFASHTASALPILPISTVSVQTGTWNYFSSYTEALILAGMTYVNFHSNAIPTGEIRGQITNMIVPTDGLREVPPVSSTAASVGMFAIDTQNKMLTYYITFTGLTTAEQQSHIHGFASVTATASPIYFFPALGSPKIGGWNYPGANEAQILQGLTYYNIHSAANPSGEIRGQIEPSLVQQPLLPVLDWPMYVGIQNTSGIPNGTSAENNPIPCCHVPTSK